MSEDKVVESIKEVAKTCFQRMRGCCFMVPGQGVTIVKAATGIEIKANNQAYRSNCRMNY